MANHTNTMNDIINDNMEIKSASYFFKNELSWGFGRYFIDFDGDGGLVETINLIEKGAKKWLEEIEKGECTADDIIEQTEEICKLLKLEELDEKHKKFYEILALQNISALTHMEHPITESDCTGAVYMYGTK